VREGTNLITVRRRTPLIGKIKERKRKKSLEINDSEKRTPRADKNGGLQIGD